jgi:hypothetical protein
LLSSLILTTGYLTTIGRIEDPMPPSLISLLLRALP